LGVYINKPIISFIDVLTWHGQSKVIETFLCCVMFMFIALEKVQATTIWKWVVGAKKTFLG
jgi:hypothetical protein